MAISKRFAEAKKAVDSSKLYEVQEAFKLAIDLSKIKFDETVELHLKLGVDGRNADQQVRGVVVLPNGTGKSVKVLVIARGDKAEDAVKAGADFVGGEEMIAKIQNDNWLGFDVCITTPDMMGVIGKIARILGPKGLMPNPKSGTVTNDVAKAITDVKKGKVEYRLDKFNNIHVSIGKISFGAEKLIENYETILNVIIKAKPASAKGQYIKNISICTTMGPGIKLDARS
ncbi:MAG: 50S ribosomal protein L1 [Clostridia bacterium]|nr:50S ribosomal protein L1 [Clostridia bacterium]